jgi:uncharacterized protein
MSSNRILLATGWLCLVLGAVGAALPLLPTTPYLLLAAWSFGRSSPRMHAFILSHPRLGPPLRRWRDERAVSFRAKILALTSMAVGWGGLLATIGGAIAAVAAIPMLAVAVFIATRASPRAP